MSAPLLGIVAAIYTYVAWDYGMQGRGGMCVAFSAYALSNIGFILDAIRTQN